MELRVFMLYRSQTAKRLDLCATHYLKEKTCLQKSYSFISCPIQDANAETAEVRIAKVAITNVALWALIWTPYAAVVLIAAFGNRELITPLVSQIPSFMAKTASCLNPIVFAVSHPK